MPSRRNSIISWMSLELLSRRISMISSSNVILCIALLSRGRRPSVCSQASFSNTTRDWRKPSKRFFYSVATFDAIAKLDVLACFAELASVRPMFGETIAIKLSRHPILDKTLGRDDCVPNDIYAAQGHASFQLIQGPNMSGKSTFLRQVGLLTVQAMLGCYRLSNDDSLDRNLSTFASEMATSAMILGLATPNSLILIDELGRGTAPLEGLGLSHAIAESLINRQVSSGRLSMDGL
ncbi:uncharacterized protein L199_005712 [Kwoniella botswanensis]|uniref:uncharacterized protein n=1 Tax=Kwoniella botswanensis TaxID=1268659 RepID=UPI00315D76FF